HRRLPSAGVGIGARILAAADAYQAMREDRPHRPARSADEAANQLLGEARAGRLDGDAVNGLLASAATSRRPRLLAMAFGPWPDVAAAAERRIAVTEDTGLSGGAFVHVGPAREGTNVGGRSVVRDLHAHRTGAYFRVGRAPIGVAEGPASIILTQARTANREG